MKLGRLGAKGKEEGRYCILYTRGKRAHIKPTTMSPIMPTVQRCPPLTERGYLCRSRAKARCNLGSLGTSSILMDVGRTFNRSLAAVLLLGQSFIFRGERCCRAPRQNYNASRGSLTVAGGRRTRSRHRSVDDESVSLGTFPRGDGLDNETLL